MTSFEGDTGPDLQYVHVRLCSLTRKNPEPLPLPAPERITASTLADQAATREIAFLLGTYPDVVRTALRTHELTDVAMFALRLGSCMRSSGDLLLTNERASQRLADRTVQEE
jgi:arginyl-tRNA synthetase